MYNRGQCTCEIYFPTHVLVLPPSSDQKSELVVKNLLATQKQSNRHILKKIQIFIFFHCIDALQISLHSKCVKMSYKSSNKLSNYHQPLSSFKMPTLLAQRVFVTRDVFSLMSISCWNCMQFGCWLVNG